MPPHLNMEREITKFLDYDAIIEKHPELKGVINPDSWNYIGKSNEMTNQGLAKLWRKNTRQNIESKMWKRHGSLRKDCLGLCKNKAILAVGAGKSLNKNLHILKQIADVDGTKSWADRNFVVIASNHQFKPLLKKDIIPDFVMITDSSDDILSQLVEDIPKTGQNTTLIANISASPKLIRRWTRQGREVRFFVPSSRDVVDEFKKTIKQDPEPHTVLVGGNVLNCMFLIGIAALGSTNFMALGNDLSYEIETDLEKRRSKYYADGDYKTTQMQDGRDEAKKIFKWMGFELEKPTVYTGTNSYNINLHPVGTSHSLWVYKTWMESWVLANMNRPDKLRFHYYNCSEGGISGVMSKSGGEQKEGERNDWFMLDDVCPRWHTMMLEHAAAQFMLGKEAMKWAKGEIGLGVPDVISLVQQRSADIVRNAMSPEKAITIHS